MDIDVVDLREFYLSALGKTVKALLRWHVARLWGEETKGTLVALGFGTPLLRPFIEKADRAFALMPGEQGAVLWPRQGPSQTALADLTALPLADESVDRVLLLHALETAPDPEGILREVWRVLKGNGRALVMVPNRHGFWAHHDDTPFGTGRPYSVGQLRHLLKEQGFIVGRTSRALYLPPLRWRAVLAIAAKMERLGHFLMPHMGGGLLIVEVEKQLYAPLAVKARQGARFVWPVVRPAAPAPCGRDVTVCSVSASEKPN